jgi:hypothetical protein
MLLDGRFIKEDLPKIGTHYYKAAREYKATPEECFIQDVLLGINPYSTSKLNKLLGKLLQL